MSIFFVCIRQQKCVFFPTVPGRKSQCNPPFFFWLFKLTNIWWSKPPWRWSVLSPSQLFCQPHHRAQILPESWLNIKNYQKGKYENLRSRPLVVVVKPWLLITIITSTAKTCRVTCVQFILSMWHRFLAGPHSWAIWRSIDNMCGHQHVELHYNCGCAQGPNVHGPPPRSYREKRVWICFSNYRNAGPRMNFRIQIWIYWSKYESAASNMLSMLIQISSVHLILFLLQGLQILPTPQKKSPEIYTFLLIWEVWGKGDDAFTLN